MLKSRAPLLLEPVAFMSSAVFSVRISVCFVFCDTLVLESKSVNRQTEMLDLGLLSWYTAGSGSVISVGQKDLG